MVNPEEIAKKTVGMLKLAFEDTENQHKHFEKLQTYLEGLGDLATSDLDKIGFPMLRMILALSQSTIHLKQQQDNQLHEMTKNVNSVLEKVIRLEKEFEAMKKGK
ncbi:hypothetical protein [Nitrosopumilus sp.]|uniref:hypothetical protein n=1 Tax=Nitrosopumilus sp. TaxID=2024843 RepID=UPI00261B9DB8|nr:hypothetical protein [Nitrosopumilus sp.]